MYTFSTNLFTNILTKSGVFRNYCVKIPKCEPTVNAIETHKTYGQPTATTHPNLLRQDEVTPYVKREEFQKRRQMLVESIAAHSLKYNLNSRCHLIVVPSATKQYMSEKIPYVFRQNSDFLYLTGCLEPDSCLVLTLGSSNKPSVTMFMREKDSHSELWDGPRTGVEGSIALFGVDRALPTTELGNYLHFYMKSNPQVTLWYDYLSPVQVAVNTIMRELLNEKITNKWESPVSFIHRLRLIKSSAEIALMQESCDVASEAIIKTIRFSRSGINEHQIFAKMEYECKMNGAEYLAYPPVVAGGNRANIIHYINNNQVVSDGEMVLMDAGCEYHGYSSDITRTWPINGKFTSQQKEIYEALLNVQTELINECYKFPSLDSLFDMMCDYLGKYLQQIGLISKSASADNVRKAAFQFCPHHVSHYLGMDVHDTPSVPRSINIRPGMVITIEPGVYISEKHRVPKEFQGMGIRVEDDVLITEDGPVVLTKKCPRSVEDIEKFASENQ